MTLSGIYKRSVVYPSLALLPVIAISSAIINRDYKSEWLTREAAIRMDIIAGLIYCLLICLLALTIFFNRYDRISSNSVLSALSWFLIPGGFICLVFEKALNEYLTVGTTYETFFALIFNLPFVAGLIWGFRRFRRLNRLQKIS